MNLSTPNKQIIFVDPSVQNYQNLIEGADANAKIVILDDKRSGLEQITKALASESGIEAVHVVSHGNQGSLKLGADVLNENALENCSHKLKQWGQALTQNADILLYGCSIAKGEAGLKFVKHFSELTGANIAASATPTGSAELGGDWNLEVQIGDISTPVPFNANTLKTYSGVLGFATKVDFTTGAYPTSVSIGDINGDGKPDLAVANLASNSASILLNTTATNATTPTFATKVDFTTGNEPISVSIRDINGDGKPDLAVANRNGSNSASILLNTTTTGATTPTFATKVDFTTGGNPFSVSIGDINGDGKPDLAVANIDSNSASILLNTTATNATTPTFATKVNFTTGFQPVSVSIGDINGDGKPDLAVANLNSNSASILLNTTATNATTPTFATQVDFTTGTNPYSVSIGDINGDGKPDLALANKGSTSASILLNTTTTGATTPTFATKVDFTTGSAPISVSIGDINGDGKPDLALANSGSNSASILLNTTTTGATTPTFATKVDFTTGTNPISVSIGDINGDGKPDLAVANKGSNTTSILLSTTPKVTAVTATTADGSYGVGFPIAITVTFDAAVNVTGTPQLQLETGTTDKFATYTSGSGGTVLTFNYVVQAGDTSADLEYLSTSALTLNGGTIQDNLTAANADLTLPALATANSLGGSKAIVIDALNDQPGFTATSPAAVNEDAGEQTLTSWATFNPGPADEAAQTATYTVSNIGNGALFSGAPTINNANGNLTYTPAPKAFGTSTFDVRVQDNGGIVNGGVDTSTTQTFTITVNGINDQPSFSNSGNQTLATSTNTLQTVPSWASAFNFGPNEAGQAVNDFLVNITNGNSLFTALPDVANDGTLTYTPNGNPGTATIQVQLQDNGGTANGGVDTSTASSFTITIPAPTVNLSVSPTTGTEAGTTSITVTATAAAPVAGNQTVDLALTGVATAADFTGTIPTQIPIADGASSGQVTFTIADDNLAEIAETANLTISNPSAGIQLGTTTTGSFTITDNDTAGFDLLPISGNTSEFGGIATFDIRLKSQPTADVILGLTSNNTAEGTVLPANLTFNSTNWNAYQTATITGVDDAVADGDIAYQIITAPDTTTADTNYKNLNPADITVTNTNNDSPGVTVTQSAGSTEVTEGGITDTYTLQLNTLPTSNVNVTVTADTQAQVSLDGTNFAAAQTLTFTNVNGQTPQTVTVRAVDDTLPENNHTGALTHAITNSTDPNYPTTLAIGPVNPQITDNDITYSVVGSTATVTEGDSGTQTVSFTVTRAGETNQSSSIDFSFGGSATSGVDYNNPIVTGTGVTATGSTVSFAANATIATIAVAIAGDRITEPNETLALTLSNATAPGTANIIGSPVTTTIQDDDTAGISITPTSGLTTTEAGGTATFTVVLDSQPTADVTIGMTSDKTAEGTVDKPSLTFTSANWNTPQTVTVTGVDDSVVDGNAAYNIVTAAATSTDTNYSGVNASDVAVTNTDNDTKGITITPITGLTTTEAGSTATFTVVLNSQPTADVTIGTTSDKTAEGTVDKPSVTFTPANWNTPQTVTVTGVDESVVDGNAAYNIVTAPATSTDTNYSGVNANDVAVTNTDNDTKGIIVTPTSGLTTTEAGGTATFTVVLNSQPTANVTIGTTSDKTAEGTVNKPSLTFTRANWNTPQTVTVTGVDDFVVDGNAAYNIVTAPATSTDTNYSSVNANDVAVTNTDNDTKGIIVTPTSGLTTTEGWGTATFTVVLNSQPTANVTIGTTSDKTAEGTVNKPSLTFTPANWNTPQTVTVTGGGDDVVDGNAAYNIVTAPATSTDTIYSGVNANDVAVTNTDNDTKGITVTPGSFTITGLRTTEAGGTAYFSVVLDSQPTADVLIGTTSDNTAEGTVNKPSLTFTPYNWNFPQTVTVTGVDDFVVDGNVAYNIVTAPATSTDTIYSGVNANDVVVINIDNDDIRALDLGFNKLQESLTNNLAAQLPLVGDKLKALAPDFLNSIKNRLITDLKAAPSLDKMKFQDTIKTSLGKDFPNLKITGSVGANGEAKVLVNLSKEYTKTLTLDANLGLPALGLNTQGNANATFKYGLDLGLGLNQDGFFFDTTNTKLALGAEVGLAKNFTGKANLGFLQLDLANNGANPTKITGDFKASLKDLTTAQGGINDGKLTLNELSKGKLSDLIGTSLDTKANLGLSAKTSVNGSAAIPSFNFDLNAGFSPLSYKDGKGSGPQKPSVEFKNMQLDLGSFITGFAKPIITKVNDVVKPARPIINALNSDIKPLSEFSAIRNFFDQNRDGKVTLIEAGATIAGKKIDTQFLDGLQYIGQASDLLKNLSSQEGNIAIDLGDYAIDFDATNPTADTKTAKTTKTKTAASPTDQAKSKSKGKTQELLTLFQKMPGLSFPILSDPQAAINLLMGKPDVTLFAYKVPKLDFKFTIDQTFPIYSIPVVNVGVNGKLEGNFEAKANFGFGFDTSGLSQWKQSGFKASDASKVLDGFYVSDRQNADGTGPDVNELKLKASIKAGGGVDAKVARAYLTGGIEANAKFDLLDVGEDYSKGTSGDGKIRASEITSRISNPLSLFEINGDVKATLDFKAEYWKFGWKTAYEKRLGEMKLADFRLGTGSTRKSRAIDGYISGGKVFFDGNFNGVQDDTESFAFTNPDGSFDLTVELEKFDNNKDGKLDYTEGKIVMADGIDISTFLPLDTQLSSTPESEVVTPLTTIIAELAQQGIDPETAETQVKLALGLPADVDLGSYDPLEAIANGDAKGVGVFASMVMVQNTIVQTAKLIEGASEIPLTQLGNRAAAAIADTLKAGTPVDLSKPETIQAIVQSAIAAVATQDSNLNTQQLARVGSAAAQVMALGNQIVQELAASGRPLSDIATEITKLQPVSVGQIAVGLAELAAGTKTIEQFLADNTKEKILEKMGQVSVNDPTVRPTFETIDPKDLLVPLEPTSGELGTGIATETPTAIDPTPSATASETPTPSETASETPTTSETPNPTPTTNNLSDDDCICDRITYPNLNRPNSVENTILGASGLQIGTAQNDELLGSNAANIFEGKSGDDNLYGGADNDIINGNQGNDFIAGGKDEDTLYGDEGSDIILGESGNDLIFGGKGNDLLHGREGIDIIYGNKEDDFIDGGKDNDTLYGGKGNDTMLGSQGDDYLFGQLGSDTICGGEGNDLINGDEGADILGGCAGNDTLFGGADNDTLTGGKGDDMLDGGLGNDSLIGGSGNDIFVLKAGQGFDIIADFTIGQDLIGLGGGLSFGQLEMTQNTQGTLIKNLLTGEQLGVLAGVNANAITSANFLLV